MNLLPVNSSNLSAIGYDEIPATLEVHFRNGTAYRYLNVPKFVFEALIRAPSKGGAFNEMIRVKYQFMKFA